MSWRSLKTRLLVPVLALLALAAALLVGLFQHRMSRRLISELELRGRTATNTIAAALESSPDLHATSRLVMSLAAERDVQLIVVVAGEPSRVIASSRAEWVGLALQQLPSLPAAKQLRAVLESERVATALHDESAFSSTEPLRLYLPELDPLAPVRGAITIQFETGEMRHQLESVRNEGLAGVVGVITLMGVALYLLLVRQVLRPITTLRRLASEDAAGQSSEWATLETDDELGTLTSSVRKTLQMVSHVLHALQDQKDALDEHAIVAVTDTRGRITYVNDRFCKISGYSRDELLGRTHAIVNSGHHPRAFFAQMWSTLVEGKVWRGELCNRARSGGLYWVDTTIVPMRNAGGHIEQYVAIRADITDRKAAEAALLAARDAAEAANKSKSEFLATMSHEIRTPMNGVIGSAQILAGTNLDADQQKWLRTITQSGEALLDLINDILDLSKIEAGRIDLESRPFQLGALLDSVLELLSPRAQARAISLKLDKRVPSHAPAWLLGDETRLRQILLNLVGNAIKFTKQGSVTLRVCMEEGRALWALRVEVEDTGEGISKEAQARLFTRFSQADASTTRRFGGTGLGLAISRQLVEVMGGSIGVHSELGAGSTFWFELALPASTAPTHQTGVVDPRESLTGLKVLVAEDNVVNMTITRAMLQKLGVQVTFATTGREAVDHFSRHEFDVVLMDCHMPVLDGFSATRAIRALEGDLRHTPIVALTASATTDDQRACTEAGMDAFLSKPIIERELQRQLQHLGRPRPNRPVVASEDQLAQWGG